MDIEDCCLGFTTRTGSGGSAPPKQEQNLIYSL